MKMSDIDLQTIKVELVDCPDAPTGEIIEISTNKTVQLDAKNARAIADTLNNFADQLENK